MLAAWPTISSDTGAGLFLKRIILEGFKSFADRSEFDFGPGITSIVGPNGCGKSNVLDAVRWVLGEQSAKSLRGDAMADVIFSGSRSRKPANCAEVQLVFDNRSRLLPRDEDEISVGRLLYRNGDSEYRLNNHTCRLKDIRELLLDTGVGVDAYSIIEQGRVDRLLAASPVERREIFEEAAGISRYRVRRTEAQRKLERAQQNLLRLNDVLDELEKRLRSVKLAAGKARHFQEYDARLRELRSSFSLAEYHQLEQARIAAEADIAAREEQITARRTDLAAGDAEAAEQSAALQALDEQIQTAEGDLLALQADLSARQERIAGNERRSADLDEARARRVAQAADAERRATELAEQLLAAEALLGELIAAEEQSAGVIDELGAARQAADQDFSAARALLEQERLATYDAGRRAALLQNQQTNLEQDRDRLTGQSLRLGQRREVVISEKAALGGRLEDARQRLGELDALIHERREALTRNDGATAALRGTLAECERKLAEAAQLRSGLLSRLDVLEGMERRREGVDAGTRTVLEWVAPTANDTAAGDSAGTQVPSQTTARFGGVVGLAADLLRIDDPRLNALQAVLAGFESHVVVENAAHFVAALRERGTLPGALRVLALDRLLAPPVTFDYAGSPGFVARAIDWVSCAPEHRTLAEHLLGRTIVVETIDHALAMAAGAGAGSIFVTLDGHTVGADGRLTIGTPEAGGLISRKTEIRHVQGEVEEVESRQTLHGRERHELQQNLSDLSVQRESHTAELARLQREHGETRTAELRTADELQRLERETANLDVELAGLRRAQDELAERYGQIARQRATAAEEEQSHLLRLDAMTSGLREREAAQAAAAERLTAALVERTRISEKRSAAEQSLTDSRRRLTTLQAEHEAGLADAQRLAAQIEQTQAALLADRERVQIDGARREACHAGVLGLRERRQALRVRLEECSAYARDIQRDIEEREAAVQQARLNLRETQVRQENLVQRIHDELGVALPDLYAGYQAAERDWSAVESEIQELRQKIARLGHVNLDAITELEELSPRFDNMVAQKADLTDSIERLQSLITELDRESQSRFAASFEQIRENFQELFRKLFGGGKADVFLENPEQPLETGIEIIARPPGKEPQSLSLLSGGEKTMTTVALLMAVFKSRPSPFTFLDEVDAALDEANVERFNMMLAEFLSHSQFIVITHSKRTMQHADVLYGITMEEPGVSKRVSVRFDDVRVKAPSVA